jgi:hypothetical protein
MRLATEAIDRLADANRRHNLAQADETAKLWQELGEVREEVLALANRLEALTRAFTASPAEVAQRGYIRLLDDTDSA